MLSQALTQTPCLQVWTHPWVTGSLVGKHMRPPTRLLLRDPVTDAIQPSAAIVAHLTALGASGSALVRDLAANECNHLTASYYLFAEALAAGDSLPVIAGAGALADAGVWRTAAKQHSVHSFSLDIDDPGDRDDGAHFAPVLPKSPVRV